MDGASDSVTTRMVPSGPVQPLRSVLLGFGADAVLSLVIGVALLLTLSIAWSFLLGFRTALAGADAAEVGRVLAHPDALTQIVIVMIAMGSTALMMCAWRQPASAPERSNATARILHPRTLVVAAGFGVAIFLCTSAASWLLQRLGVPPDPSNIAPLREAFARSPIFVVLFTVVIAPLYEELLFRRVFFRRFWNAGRPVLGMWLSGLVFALSHEIPGLGDAPFGATLCLMLVYTAMGAVFAWLYRRTDTLWAAILAHALNNAFALGLLFASGSL